MQIIRLYGGAITLVDDEDGYLAAYTWYLKKVHGNAYAQGRMEGQVDPIYMHRIILERMMGEQLGKRDCDHANGFGLDNRRNNLRAATRGQNIHNSGARKTTNSLGTYKGVTFDKRTSRWYARIRLDGITYDLGRFDDEQEAARAYDAKARELCGEFAWLNFPPLRDVV